jgi:hypothetical protein
MKHKATSFLGIVIILSGVVLLLANIGIIDIATFWPLIPLAIGCSLIFVFTRGRKESSLLLAGIVLVFSSLLFQYCIFTGWESMTNLWPILLLAIGCGFLFEYLFVSPNQAQLSLATILLLAALCLLLLNYILGKFWPMILILLGILYIAFTSIGKSVPKSQADIGEQKHEKESSQKDT